MIKMENLTKAEAKAKMNAAAAELRGKLLKNIGAKWDRLSEADVAGLKNADGLATLLVAKYGADKQQALLDVEKFLKGRPL